MHLRVHLLTLPHGHTGRVFRSHSNALHTYTSESLGPRPRAKHAAGGRPVQLQLLGLLTLKRELSPQPLALLLRAHTHTHTQTHSLTHSHSLTAGHSGALQHITNHIPLDLCVPLLHPSGKHVVGGRPVQLQLLGLLPLERELSPQLLALLLRRL